MLPYDTHRARQRCDLQKRERRSEKCDDWRRLILLRHSDRRDGEVFRSGFPDLLDAVSTDDRRLELEIQSRIRRMQRPDLEFQTASNWIFHF